VLLPFKSILYKNGQGLEPPRLLLRSPQETWPGLILETCSCPAKYISLSDQNKVSIMNEYGMVDVLAKLAIEEENTS
jgi:hypothetical protein